MQRSFLQRPVGEFIGKESIGGFMLMLATVFAMIICNTRSYEHYQHLLNVNFSVLLGTAGIKKPVLLWINDGMMTIFFFVIGLELKRECVTGHLSDIRNVILPAVGAVGGVIVPVIVFIAFNTQYASHLKGWAIPMATDIAFALGITSLFAGRISREMKVFLLTLAIIDDIIAIIVIALFHTDSLSWYSLLIALICICILSIMNLSGVRKFAPYLLVGLFLWLSVLQSGVHATLSGVILAMFIPMHDHEGDPMLKKLEDDLHPIVAYVVLPAFAFANAGIHFEGFTWTNVTHSLTLGIAMGLLIGKPLGVVSFTYVAKRITNVEMNISWLDVVIIGCFAGIGFTMSLFIASLSFNNSFDHLTLSRFGILLGSLLSIVLATIITLCFKPIPAEAKN